ncbi:hypothetical protein MMC17_010268 [Xylographa soralifera]|nr:hypothetical protein [Xylographa soralifera]
MDLHTTVDNDVPGWENVKSSATSTNAPSGQQKPYSGGDTDEIEPVAIVGISFKFPQDATSANGFWKLMMEGRCTATEFPPARLSLTSVHHPDPNRRDTTPVRGGNFLKDNMAAFDAPFFSISATEAAAMDPQQRGLLETTYRALESAGIPTDKVFGSKISVYTGCFTNDWQQLCFKDSEQTADYAGIGVESSMNANRISWFFTFTGGSTNIDTACSSSLVALDLACRDLINGEVNMAVAAGCNMIFSPDLLHVLSNMNMLSPNYRCFSFDSRANGYARGEGLGVIILKRLSTAIADGDSIRAVVRATGTNQDGHTQAIMQPSNEAQERLIRDTYSKAGLNMESTRFFEAHGTGTPVGDPLETEALGSAFRKVRSPDDPLYVGAVKSNIGHLEGASGIASVIKSVLILEKGVIPPNTNFERLNPKIDAAFLRIKFPLVATPWPTNGLRRISVNSFGFGGTNAHIILDDAYHYLEDHGLVGHHNTVREPPLDPTISTDVLKGSNSNTSFSFVDHHMNSESPQLLVFSAHDEAGLKRMVAKYLSHFQRGTSDQREKGFLTNLAYTLGVRRTHLRWRSFLIASSPEDLTGLDTKMSLLSPLIENAKLGFVFTGQGAQWAQMGHGLSTFTVFRRSLQEAEDYFRQIGCPWLLHEELLKDSKHSSVNKPEYSQPLCVAVQVALVDLLHSFGVQPAAMVGHSSGEIAAAYCAGAISARTAWRLAYYRGLCAANLAENGASKGAMMSVGLSESQAKVYIDAHFKARSDDAVVTVACINSSHNVTLSGEKSMIEDLKQRLDDLEVFARVLKVNVAYHSPYMNAIASEYADKIQNLEARPGSSCCTMISSVTGKAVTKSDLCSTTYWLANMVSPVRFSDALKKMCDQSTRQTRKKLDCSHRDHLCVDMLVEVGPHSALRGPVRDNLAEISAKRTRYVSTLIRDHEAIHTLLDTLGNIHCLGFPVQHESIICSDNDSDPSSLTSLPEYPFDRSQEFWQESRISKRFRTNPAAKSDLLGKAVSDWNPMEAKWRNFIRVSDMPWIEDHVVNGAMLYPAAGMLVMAIEAAKQSATKSVKGYRLRDVLFSRALTIPQHSDGIETGFYLRNFCDTSDSCRTWWSEFRLCAYHDDQWKEHCRGFIQIEYEADTTQFNRETEDLDKLRFYKAQYDSVSALCSEAIEPVDLYTALNSSGFGFGPAFQRLKKISRNSKGQAEAEVELYQWPGNQFPQLHVVHPTSLDGVLHLSIAATSQDSLKEMPTAIPTLLRSMWIASSGLSSPENGTAMATATAQATDNRGTESNVLVLDASLGRVLARIEGLRVTIVADPRYSASNSVHKHQTCYRLEYQPDLDLLNASRLSNYCAKVRTQTPNPIQYFRDLTFLLFVFLSRALEALDDAKPIVPHLQKYLNWARLQLQRYHDGELPHSQPGWEQLRGNSGYVDALCTTIEATNDQGRIFVTTGQRLPAIIGGDIDPLEFFFESDLIRDFYREINNNRTCFPEFDRCLSALAHKYPNMKILEIGAGTGGTTAKLLHTLTSDGGANEVISRYSSYTYTDISISFFEQAREDFRQYPRMYFQSLNIELDPIEQGYKSQAYDLVIAANVLHATKDINVTMRHVRKLMKPGAKLMMYESTQPDILRTGFVAGLLPGWWLGVESFRPWGPSLTLEIWQRVLSDNAFSGLDLELPDFVDPECQEGSILLSTAISSAPSSEIEGDIAIVFDSCSELQVRASQQMKQIIKNEFSIQCETITLPEAASTSNILNTTFLFLIEIHRTVLFDMSEQVYLLLQKLLVSSKALLWITGGGGAVPTDPAYAVVDGLSRALRNENPDRRFSVVALATEDGFLNERQIELLCEVLHDNHSKDSSADYEPEYVEINGRLNVPRAVKCCELPQDLHKRSLPQQSAIRSIESSAALKLAIGSTGLLDTLHFIEDEDIKVPLAPDDIEIRVHGVGMNFKDCLIALGRVPGTAFGNECAGTVTRTGTDCDDLKIGDRVVMCTAETFKTFARGKAHHVCKIPKELTFLEAASIPVQFGTAWQVIHHIARIQKNETILIHAGAGGTGQAAIQIAQYHGAEVFATVSSDSKRQILIKEYGVSKDHIFYSRNADFAKGVKRMTKGRGVDIVINALAGDSLVASWECISSYGRFIEIGKKDILSNSSLPMYPFRKNASFTAFDGSLWLWEQPVQAQKGLQTLLTLFAEKRLHIARPFHVHDISSVEEVFRLMQDGNAAGKFVLEIKPDSQVMTSLRTKLSYNLDPGATYLVAGGLGGLGRDIARWMVGRGARNLILLSRSGGRNQTAWAFLKDLAEQGVTVEAPPCDVADITAVQAALKHCASRDMPPIRGCVQGSMVLKDALFENMSYSDWKAATDCKTIGSWNLHNLLPKGMDFFIMLSSASGVCGLPGQANYAAGNTYMDCLARYRVSHGEKGVSLDLGVMLDDGLLAENKDFLDRVLAYGALDGISREEFHTILDYYCDPTLAVLSTLNSQAIIRLGTSDGLGQDGLAPFRQRLFSHMRLGDDTSGNFAGTGVEDGLDNRRLFGESSSLLEAGDMAAQALVKKLAKTLSTLQGEVDLLKPLRMYGVNSLLGVELRSWILKEFAADIPVFEILGGSTSMAVGNLIATRSQLRHDAWSI